MNLNLANNGDLAGIVDLGFWIFGLLCGVVMVFMAVVLTTASRRSTTWALPGGRPRTESDGSLERGIRQNQAFEMFGRLSRPRAGDPPSF